MTNAKERITFSLMSKTNFSKTVSLRIRAFSTEPMGTYQCMVEPDGSVYVYDSVAGHYTRCHALSENQLRRVRRLAAVEVAS